MTDELDTRIRSLEAERMRPVPPPPPRPAAEVAQEDYTDLPPDPDSQERLHLLLACIDDDQLDDFHATGGCL